MKILKINKEIYEIDTVLKTANKFADKYYLNIENIDNQLIIKFTSKNEAEFPILDTVLDDFSNELIDQQVRAMVQKECSSIRDKIVEKAFSPLNGKRKS
jgi:His-Xaa-Ser system protein HxsD